MNEFRYLYDRIAHGWWKLNDDGSRTIVGSQPHLDLYGAVRSLDRRLPVAAEISEIFEMLARTIVDLYPERIQTEILTAYDARIAVFEFNDHADTTQADVLRIVLGLEARGQPMMQATPRPPE